MSFYITFKGTTSTSVGLEVVRRPNIPAAEPVYEPYEIPGRDGVLMPSDVRYGAIEIDVEMNLMASSPDTVGAAYQAAKAWLTGSGNLSFSDMADGFYKVYSASIIEVERSSYRIVTFIAHFVCDPYFYFTSGTTLTDLSASNTIVNSTAFVAEPFYRILVAAGSSASITVNNTEITFTGRATAQTWFYVYTSIPTVVDSTGASQLSRTSGDITKMKLQPGNNTIVVSGGSNPQIRPYWRTL